MTPTDLIARWEALAQEYRDEARALKEPELKAILQAWAQARANCALELRQVLRDLEKEK